MISKSFSIRAFIALATIASSLTSSVNAAAVVSPARISRDLVPGSVPALMMARINEERDEATDQTTVHICTNSATDSNCLLTLNVLAACRSLHDPNSDHTGLHNCIQNLCPDTTGTVIDCVIASRNGNASQGLTEPCTSTLSTGDSTCLQDNTDMCSTGTSDPGTFGSCLSSSCPDVSQVTINCVEGRFQQVFG